VARRAHWWLHRLFGVVLVLMLGVAALGWRLSEGPIEVPALARAIEEQVNRDAPGRLEIGAATLGWEGWREGHLTPVELRLDRVRLRDAAGGVRAELPAAGVSLSIPWLLRGELAPRALEVQGATLRLRRDADGAVSVALGDAAATEADAPSGPSPVDELLAQMMQPPSDATPLSALQALRIQGGRIAVSDAQLGLVWSLEDTQIELRRLPQGGLSGRGSALLLLGAGRVPLSFTAEAAGAPAELRFRLALPEVHPAVLAAAAPALAPLAHLDAPARIEAAGRLEADGTPKLLQASITAGAGMLDLGAGRRIPIAAAEAQLEAAGTSLRLPRLALRLPSSTGTALHARAEARREGGGWQAAAELELDGVPLAELARFWPEGLGTGERDWILANITAGTARNGRWQLRAEAPADLSAISLTALSGTLDVADATVHWLRPMPPVEGAQGRIAFSPTEVTVQVAAARQAGTQLQAREATLRFLFPDGAVPTTEMQIGLAGPLPELLGLLQHPRLRLFDRRPIPLKDPRGTLDGRLTLGFPLIEALQVEQMRIRGEARLREVRLADVVLGQGIERGQFDVTVETEGLRLNGNAVWAEIPVRANVEMDFRAGNASQVVSRETVTARADVRQLAALGLAFEELGRGPVALDVRSERRRGGAGRVTVRADLRETALMLDPLGWRKPPGQNAGGDLVLRLSGENLEAIESFRVEAPSLRLRGDALFARGTRLERVTIAEGVVDGSRFGGEARPPRGGGPWTVTLRGAALDLRRALADAPAASAAPPPSRETGPSVLLDGSFDRVLLGEARELGAVRARVQMDERGVLREGRIAGRAGPGGFEATLSPSGQGRALRATSEDAGALLLALDVLKHIQGGRLTVNAHFAHNAPGAPLSGSAEMLDFSVRNAPGLGKLLQAMTLYGLVEAMSGPGLGFSRLVAPFTLTPETLTLAEARAFSASLGLTARGTLDRRRQRLDLQGTIVPAYIFNSLLGNIPVLGRIFSPETGGGVFAATFRVQGPAEDPQVSVNPLAALTPGFLRGLFGLGQNDQPAR
jgi:hypothetical protein